MLNTKKILSNFFFVQIHSGMELKKENIDNSEETRYNVTSQKWVDLRDLDEIDIDLSN